MFSAIRSSQSGLAPELADAEKRHEQRDERQRLPDPVGHKAAEEEPRISGQEAKGTAAEGQAIQIAVAAIGRVSTMHHKIVPASRMKGT